MATRAPKLPPAPLLMRCDHRETAVIERLMADPSVQVEICQFEIGDFELAPGLFCERKAAADVTASILDKRLFGQVEAAKAVGVKLVFLIEGDPFKIRRLHDNAMIGALSYIAVVEGFPLVQVPNLDATCEFLKRASKHARDGLGYEISMRAATPKSISSMQLYLVEGLPGIGRDRAKALLAHFGSVRGVFAAGADEIRALPGFGDVIASDLQVALDAHYEVT